MHARVLRRLALCALSGVVLASSAGAQNLTGAGATFPYPIYSKWFDVYKQKTGVEINYQSIGSGAGIQQVKAGTVDFGASDAALSDAALKDMPRKVLHFPTVAGAVVLAYNLPDLKSPLQLSPDVIVGIYLGRITTWNDKRIAAVNPGAKLPAAPILAVHRSDGSGTTNIYANYLAAVSSEWKELVGAGTSVSWPSGVGGKGNDGVAGVIKQTPGAIGYVELAYAKHNQLTMALVRNKSGKFMEASLASTTAAVEGAAALLAKDVRTPIVNSAAPDAYPIAGLTFLLVYQDGKDPAQAKALADFIAWAIHDGQSYADDLDYAKLPDAVVKLNEATLRQLSAGGKRLVAEK
jgi:phosphate transport system substrate-binding protein